MFFRIKALLIRYQATEKEMVYLRKGDILIGKYPCKDVKGIWIYRKIGGIGHFLVPKNDKIRPVQLEEGDIVRVWFQKGETYLKYSVGRLSKMDMDYKRINDEYPKYAQLN